MTARLPLALSWLVLGACAPPADTGPTERQRAEAKVLVAEARILGEESRTTDALRNLNDALALDPELESAHRARIDLGPRAAMFDAVIASADWVLERHPDELETWIELARAGLNAGRIEVARRALETADELDGDQPMVHSLWARLYFELGDLERAERRAKRSTELVPEQTTPHYLIGLAADERGDLDAAIAAYRRVLHVDPGHLGARDHIATALLRDGRRKESNRHREVHSAILAAMPGGFRQLPPTERIESFSALTELVDDWHMGWIELGRAQYQFGAYADAARSLRRALELRFEREAHSLLALVLEASGDLDGAARHAALAEGTVPSDPAEDADG